MVAALSLYEDWLPFATAVLYVLIQQAVTAEIVDYDEANSPWRWALVWAAAAAIVVGYVATSIPEWSELLLGLPAILISYGAIIWVKGFTKEDRVLFRLKKGEEPTLPPPAATGGGD